MAEVNILRFPQVQAKTGLCRSSIKNYVTAGKFPAPVQIGPRAVGFVEAEVNEWFASRVAASRKKPI